MNSVETTNKDNVKTQSFRRDNNMTVKVACTVAKKFPESEMIHDELIINVIRCK